MRFLSGVLIGSVGAVVGLAVLAYAKLGEFGYEDLVEELFS